ncbi:hypothetical protein BJ741DRAFT_589699 [Chytriomyces cf. hyalinus JEL632]|nr:hypothetical protein BJ741DRAFT_589699 [Chytriomyces cf. hyalinus JEL632]
MAKPSRIYLGTVIHSLSLGCLQVIERAAVAVDKSGRIVFVKDTSKCATTADYIDFPGAEVVELGARILIPGFIDGHAHAPQQTFLGTGMHLPLLKWLEAYTFPKEAKFSDPVYAATHYRTAVKRHLFNGTTTCSYFATIHLESTKALVDIVLELGQRGLVGKVNMDRNSPSFLVEETDTSLKDTQTFIDYVLTKNNPLVQPVITPRFIPSVTSPLLTGLGKLSISHTPPIRVQSHLSENRNEIAWVLQMHPENPTYASVYDSHGLLHDRSYMAHCVWCTQSERDLLQSRSTGVIHCPNSNFSLSSGILNVRRLLREGVKVGLGTDVSGGYTPSMLDAIRQAVIASKMVSIGQGSDAETGNEGEYDALSYAEAFHLATMGSAECLSLGDTVGNFLEGKDFDALVLNLHAEGSPVDVFEGDSTLELFQRFLFVGDDRNIEQVYVAGKRCK